MTYECLGNRREGLNNKRAEIQRARGRIYWGDGCWRHLIGFVRYLQEYTGRGILLLCTLHTVVVEAKGQHTLAS